MRAQELKRKLHLVNPNRLNHFLLHPPNDDLGTSSPLGPLSHGEEGGVGGTGDILQPGSVVGIGGNDFIISKHCSSHVRFLNWRWTPWKTVFINFFDTWLAPGGGDHQSTIRGGSLLATRSVVFGPCFLYSEKSDRALRLLGITFSKILERV